MYTDKRKIARTDVEDVAMPLDGSKDVFHAADTWSEPPLWVTLRAK